MRFIILTIVLFFPIKSFAFFEADYADQCAEYGFRPGTVEFAQCVQTETNAFRQRLGNALSNMGEWSDPEPLQFYEMKTNSNNNRMNCTSSYAGNSVFTNCN